MENKENMDKVKELMLKAQAEEVRLGGNLQTGVAIDYATSFGIHYVGTIVFKKPTMQDYMRMGAIKSEYLRRAGVVDVKLVDTSIKEMAQIMAVLSTVIVKRPDWLMDIDKVEEPELLFHIYDKYEEWESSFRKSSAEAPNGDSTATK